MKRKINARPALIFGLLLVLVVVAGCQRADVEKASAMDKIVKKAPAITEAANGETTSSEDRGAEARAGNGVAVAKSGEAEARAGDGEARAGGAVAGNGKAEVNGAVAGGEGAGEGRKGDVRSGKVKLKVLGAPGTRFSGTCDLGGEKQEVSGQVPGRFVYDLEGRGIACEIQSKETEAGELKFSVNISGSRKQKIKATADNMSFSFSGESLSYTTSSNSDGTSVQKTKVTSSSNSSVSSSSESR